MGLMGFIPINNLSAFGSVYNHYLTLFMTSLELDYQTWEREDCYGMFDYSETKNIKQHHKIVIKSSGKLVRNIRNHQLTFLQPHELTIPTDTQPFLKVEFNQDRFFLGDQSPEDAEPLMSINPLSSGTKLKEGDRIKLGKASLRLIRLVWGAKNRSNHYEMVKEPIVAEKQSIFASSFYSQKEKASFLENNPCCKYCLSKSIDDENPFMALCNCSGHTKYIHLSCLVEWVQKRKGISEDYPREGVYCAQAKAFTCEVCKSLYRLDRLLSLVFGVSSTKFQDFAVFMVEIETPLIYVIDLKQSPEISIGRNLESLMIINELSVSRKHCKLVADRVKKELVLVDNGGKFGTGVETNRIEVSKSCELQKGRTKMKFTKTVKLGLLERIGFCSPQENLGTK